jgi:acyl carrier protein
MDAGELRAVVLEELARIAPELEPSALSAARPLRDQVDLDSMDWLNFLVGLHERLKVDIPEADYAELGTLEQLVAYLERKHMG